MLEGLQKGDFIIYTGTQNNTGTQNMLVPKVLCRFNKDIHMLEGFMLVPKI